jgi:uncharacterized membrane protein YbhN (UPF0104 family)
LLSRALVFRLAVTLVLATLIYGALLFYSDAKAIAAELRTLDGRVIATATGLALASYALRLVRWSFYLRCLALRVPAFDSALIFVAGFAMSITPGKVGEVLKPLMLRDAHDVPITQSATLVIAERVTDLLALLVLGGFGLLGTPVGVYAASAASLLTLAVAVLMSSPPLGERLLALVGRVPRLRAVHGALLEAYRSLLTLLAPRAFVVALVLALGSWGAQAGALFVVANAFPHVQLGMTRALVAYSAPLLAGTLAMIPGGLGLTEASMTGVLVSFGGASVPVATTISLVVRVVTFWLAIALGFSALGLWQARRARTRSAQPDA